MKAWFWICLAALPLASCPGGDDGEGGSGADGGSRGGSRGGTLPAAGPECLASDTALEISTRSIDKLDLLFVVDDSDSMREEQAALREQFPRLIDQLTTGERADGSTFLAVTDLHLGVVSSDMGLAGIDGIPGCAGLGDDGIMENAPSQEVTGCQASYPRFLSYVAEVHDPAQAANDFACIATLGTDGCSFEQQLEAGLKALWPSVDIDPATGREWVDRMTGQPGNRIEFLSETQGSVTLGHGDTDNAGFLRSDPQQGLSAIAIVVVTDEEDCSSADTRHFTPPDFLEANDPLRDQPLNLRCFYNSQNLYPLDRYINGFKALRPGNENLVLFFAIAGVPPDLTGLEDYAAVDFENEAERYAFYDRLLANPRMQEVVDPNLEPGMHNLLPSCNTETGTAYPPRRIVEVARGFGANGAVYSICQSDLAPAIDGIVDRIARQLGEACLPGRLERDGRGLVGNCDLYWELPPEGEAPASTPANCGDPGFEFLLSPRGSAGETERGGAVCKVPQLAVRTDASGVRSPIPTEANGTTFGDGWYYDDFSERVASCLGGAGQRIAFTDAARPPSGVVAKLECLIEQHVVDRKRTDIDTAVAQPRLGDPCDVVFRNNQTLTGDEACVVRLAIGERDASMFCHPERNACVASCSTDADCPEFWTCDDSPGARAGAGDRAFCTPPSCSAGPESASAEHVGDRCLTATVPALGFDGRRVYVSAPSPNCSGGPCLVFKLDGDPRANCVPIAPDSSGTRPGRTCVTPADIEQRVYCSCRCDAPEGFAECECPSGYNCVDAIAQGSDEIRGGYCVRDGTFVARSNP